jgi:phage terminase large subunit-like protein
MSEEIVTKYKGRGRPRKTDEIIKEPEPTYIENPKEELRRLCEKDFYSFIRTVAPYAVMGAVHEEVCTFLQDLRKTTSLTEPSGQYKLVMLPRAHRKSFLLAMYASWRICRDPCITIIYFSATSDLAEYQLKVIKQTLESPMCKKLWPSLIDPDEGKRAMWTNTAIIVDHPSRKREGIRDATVKTAGLTTNTTGAHADLIIGDDLVCPENNTSIGRAQVESKYAQFNSLLNPGGSIVVAGTHYDPNDLYMIMKQTQEDVYNREGEFIGTRDQWSVFERVVETDGEFIWPRTRRQDGKYFGFDMKELSRIKAGYSRDMTQFYSQYYNNPNAGGTSGINAEKFQYYAQERLKVIGGNWYLGEEPLNVFAAIDFSYSLTRRADFTVIAVVGVSPSKLYYVLALDRFQTEEIQEYFSHIMKLHNKWRFRKLSAECTAAQSVIVKALKEKLKENNIYLPIEETKPFTKKEERIAAVLQPLYEDLKIYHYKGGNCELLEEELKQAHPSHDDIKDALSNAIEIAVPPSAARKVFSTVQRVYGRFGGT